MYLFLCFFLCYDLVSQLLGTKQNNWVRVRLHYEFIHTFIMQLVKRVAKTPNPLHKLHNERKNLTLSQWFCLSDSI